MMYCHHSGKMVKAHINVSFDDFEDFINMYKQCIALFSFCLK
jgi:hypothetical protein